MNIYERQIRLQEAQFRREELLRKRIILCGIICIFAVVFFIIMLNLTLRIKDKELLQQYYEAFLEKQGLTISQTDETFSNWFFDNYPRKARKKVISALEDGTLNSKDIYEFTGESIYVLSDRYQNLIDNENMIFELSGKNANEAEITIAGDLCFAEDGFVLDYYDTVNDLKQCISPELLDITNNSDLFYLNHEYSISDRGTPLEGKYYTFRANPARQKLLEEMGVDLVSLANNHVYDYGADALYDTCDILDSSNIAYVGGGKNLEEAMRPVYYIVNGIKIGFVAASNAEKYFYTPQATETSPGILAAYDTTEFNAVIQEASKNCDYLIAYIHWGIENSNYLNEQQQTQGREFLNSGADIVVGGHPHVLQGIEYVDGKPIVYSLGDFWFNSETKYTGLLQLNISIDGLNEMSFIPGLQTNYTTQYLSTAEQQEEVYSFLEEISINVDIDSEGIITEH